MVQRLLRLLKGYFQDIRWGCDDALADRITCSNRHYAEHWGYFTETEFLDFARKEKEPITFYDVVTGKPLFKAPIGRSMNQFLSRVRNRM
mgnify:CR=1 FL=1